MRGGGGLPRRTGARRAWPSMPSPRAVASKHRRQPTSLTARGARLRRRSGARRRSTLGTRPPTRRPRPPTSRTTARSSAAAKTSPAQDDGERALQGRVLHARRALLPLRRQRAGRRAGGQPGGQRAAGVAAPEPLHDAAEARGLGGRGDERGRSAGGRRRQPQGAVPPVPRQLPPRRAARGQARAAARLQARPQEQDGAAGAGGAEGGAQGEGGGARGCWCCFCCFC